MGLSSARRAPASAAGLELVPDRTSLGEIIWLYWVRPEWERDAPTDKPVPTRTDLAAIGSSYREELFVGGAT